MQDRRAPGIAPLTRIAAKYTKFTLVGSRKTAHYVWVQEQ